MSAAAGRLIEELTAAFPQRQLSSKDTDRIRRIMDVAAAGPTTTPPDASGEPLSVDEVVLQAIEECITHFNLDVDRERLISSLTLHTRRLVARSNSFVYFRSGLRESLRTKSPFLYDVAVYLAHLISGSLGLRVTDDEISLLAIYLGLYADHPDSSADTVSVTIVCPRYQTLREWLLTKLVEHYGERIRIVDVVMSIRDAEASDCDLIITAMGGTSHATPVVEISALCSELDLDVISAALVKARETRLQHRTAALLSRFLDPDLFFVDLQFPDATSTISFLSDQLIATGKVPPAFAQSVLTREDYSSTAFSHRFAVPHSMEFLAKQTTIAVLIPKQPINWGESDVVMVLMLAINPDDYTDFSAAYQPLIHLLCQADTFAELRRLRDFDAFRSYLTERFKAGA